MISFSNLFEEEKNNTPMKKTDKEMMEPKDDDNVIKKGIVVIRVSKKPAVSSPEDMDNDKQVIADKCSKT